MIDSREYERLILKTSEYVLLHLRGNSYGVCDYDGEIIGDVIETDDDIEAIEQAIKIIKTLMGKK